MCEHALPLGPRPTVRAGVEARILVVGQAPGLRVHETGIPWNDRSGDRLREWLGVDRETFYREDLFAIVPMGFCYPGRDPRGGDLPPRKECAPLWVPRLLAALPNIRCRVLAGWHGQRFHLGERAKKNLTETVRAWRAYAPETFVLPHPSFRNQMWLRKNPWFVEETLPALRARIAEILGEEGA